MTWGAQKTICVEIKQMKLTHKQRPDPFCIASLLYCDMDDDERQGWEHNMNKD